MSQAEHWQVAHRIWIDSHEDLPSPVTHEQPTTTNVAIHYCSCIRILGDPALDTKESAHLTLEFKHHEWRGYVYLVLHATQHRSACWFLFLPCLKGQMVR